MCQLASLWSHFTIGTTSHHVMHRNPTLSHVNHVPNLGQAHSRGRVPPPPRAAGGAVTKGRWPSPSGDWVSVSEESLASSATCADAQEASVTPCPFTQNWPHYTYGASPVTRRVHGRFGLSSFCQVSAIICASLS